MQTLTHDISFLAMSMNPVASRGDAEVGRPAYREEGSSVAVIMVTQEEQPSRGRCQKSRILYVTLGSGRRSNNAVVGR